MSDELDDDVKAWLAEERARPVAVPSAIGKARLLQAVALAAPLAEAAQLAAPAPAAPATAPAAGGAAKLLGSKAFLATAALLVGGAAGALVRDAVGPSQSVHSTSVASATALVPPSPVTAPPSANVSATTAPSATELAPTASARRTAVSASDSVAGTSSARPASSEPDPSTAADPERAWIDRAQAAIARGQGAGALEALMAHESRYPAGRLTEEREALFVQALAQTGHAADAKSRAAAFEKRFPHSLYLPQVQRAAP